MLLFSIIAPALAIYPSVQLSATDDHDIRCAWSMQAAVSQLQKGDSNSGWVFAAQMWFEGLVVGRHPNFGVSTDIIRRTFTKETPPNEDELKACMAVLVKYGNDDVGGKLAE